MSASLQSNLPPPPPPFLPPDDQIREDLDSQQVKIQVALFFTFLIFTMILILGRLRARGNSTMKLFSTKAFMVTGYLVTFIPGLMNSSTATSDLYVFWVAFLAYLAAVTNEISCYSLGDNEDRKKRLIVDYAVVWPLILTSLYKSLASPEIMVPIIIIFWIVVFKLRERSHALLYATNSSNGLSRATRLVSDFDKYKKEESNKKKKIITPVPQGLPPKSGVRGDRIESNLPLVLKNKKMFFPNDPNENRVEKLQLLTGTSQVKEAQKEKSSQVNSSYNKFLIGIKEARCMDDKQPETGYGLFDIDINMSKLITLDMVLDTNDAFLESINEGNELHDTCISFTMFSVLLARMGGYGKVDVKIFKVGNELPKNSFALIEKELGFLYDYLFTNYFAIYDRGIWKKLRDLCIITLFFWLAIPLLVEYRSEDHNVLYVVLSGTGLVIDTGFTRFIILAILVIEFTQFGIFLTSKWAKVMYTCLYLEDKNLKNKDKNLEDKDKNLEDKTRWGWARSIKSNFLQIVIRIAWAIPRPTASFLCCNKFSTRKINQYSILNCYLEIPRSMWLNCWIGSYFDLPRVGQAGSTTIDLTNELQQSFLKTIETYLFTNERGGIFTNGVYSLEENNVEEELRKKYVTNVDSQARVILIWHIATSLLEDDAKRKSPETYYYNNDVGAATIISNYLAYLVAFLPQMLPDHMYTTQCVFDATIKELKIADLLDKRDDTENPRKGLNGGNAILKEAQDLVNTLKQGDDLWKILAEFWTETLMFLALSTHDKAIEAHADNLCVGGEFITHLWALLTHSGCRKAPYEGDIKGQHGLTPSLNIENDEILC